MVPFLEENNLVKEEERRTYYTLVRFVPLRGGESQFKCCDSKDEMTVLRKKTLLRSDM